MPIYILTMKEKIWAFGVFSLVLTTLVVVVPSTTSEETPPEGWSDDLRLTEVDDYSSRGARVAVDSMNDLHIVWNDYRHGPSELYYMKLDENGNIVVDETTLTTLDSISSRLGDCACDSQDNIHIVWDDIRDSGPIPNMEIYYMKLDNMGNTLIDETRITHFPHNSLYASMTIDSSDNVHIVWCEEVNVYNILQEEIFYTKLDNNGNTLVNDLALTESDGEESLFPDIEADSNGNIHVVWLDDRNETGTTKCQDVYYTKLDNNGNTIIDDTKIFVRGDFYRPNIIIDSNDMIHLACGSLIGWKGNVYKQIYYVKMDNDGDPLFEEIRLTNDDENASHPTLHLDTEENVHIVWEDERHENTEIYYMKVDNEGNILLDELRLTINSSSSAQPEIALDGNNKVNVVWADGRDYPEDKMEVYHKQSSDGIINSPPSVVITSPIEGQTVSGNVIIQGWANDMDGEVQEVKVKIDDKDEIIATGTYTWVCEWDSANVDNGLHKICAVSFDGFAQSDEYIINITVNNGPVVPPNNPPTVKIKPFESDTISGYVVIKGEASDTDGNVLKVEVNIDGEKWIKASGTTSWTRPWDTTQKDDGEHVIYARAQDDAEEYSTVKSIKVTVDNIGNTPPQVDIISPTGGKVSAIVVIHGTASDIDGNNTITFVQVKIEGDWKDAVGTEYWSYNWDTSNLDDGEYIFSVRAFDGTDHSEIKSVTVYVDNPHPPSLTITSDIPEKVSGTIMIQGIASDTDGKIVKIEIQIDDGEWEGIEVTPYWSYELDTNRISNGDHIVQIRVTDDESETQIDTLTIKVDNPVGIPWWIFLLGLIILIILISVIAILIRGKETLQPNLEMLKCLKCGHGFEADVSIPIIQCPNCGFSGTT